MGKTVGVRSWIDIHRSPSIKREALLFDQVGITHLDTLLGQENSRSSSDIDDLEWLCEQDIVFDLGTTSLKQLKGNEEFDRYYDLRREELKNLLTASAEILLSYERKGNQKVKKTHSTIKRQQSRFNSVWSKYSDYDARCAAIHFRDLHRVQAYPILSSPMPSLENAQAKKVDVIQIVLHALPQPSETVPWEKIIEFRNDPDTAHHFLALRNWMTETAKAQLTPLEIEEKIEYLVSQYGQHTKLHKLKTNTGIMETTVVAGAEFLEDIVKLKWGKVAKGLFSLQHRRIALMEGELTAPGNQLAYIERARQTFS